MDILDEDVFIHPSAIVRTGAIGEGVKVGPYSVIGPEVTLES
ncbi:MAG: acyl-ACP--UDP-N-acetylglucosamine O-acyltransferase, partial [Dissulfurimicrobium sp.]